MKKEDRSKNNNSNEEENKEYKNKNKEEKKFNKEDKDCKKKGSNTLTEIQTSRKYNYATILLIIVKV